MKEINKIEKEELENKIGQIKKLSIEVKNSFIKFDDLIDQNVNSGKGIWDGEDAKVYKEEWENQKENIPNIINIYNNQAENIENILKMTSQE